MNENDGRDREVRGYVRNRMAADMPPEFTRDVMNDVHRTTQGRRGFAWPIFRGLATVAAAVAVVVIALGLIYQSNGVGSEPSPSSSPSERASPEATPSPTPGASASEQPAPSATVEPTTGDGEFGPVHSLDPETAFEDGQSCEVSGVITTVDTDTDVGWTISIPEGWFTNDDTDTRSACTLFASEPFEVASDGTYPQSVEIVGNLPPGGDFSTGNEITRTDNFTVDGVAAVRHEIAASSEGGFASPSPSVLWIIAVAGDLPAEGNDQPYLAIGTGSADPDELAARVDILDRMVATLNIGK
jgi:hypothetical protein